MRAKPFQINALTDQIQNEFRGAFIFGPEENLVQQTAQKIAKMIVPDLKDDFCVLKSTASILKENPHYLTEEANALSLMSGRKLLWMQEVDQNTLAPLQEAIQNIQTDSFLLLMGGNLPSKSALCTFCGDHEKILTIACYAPKEEELAQQISDILKENGFSCSSEALSCLVQRLQENTLMMNGELQKLMVYKGTDTAITLSDVEFVITQTSGGTFDELCVYMATGQLSKADSLCTLLLEEIAPVSLLHMLAGYFHKILQGNEWIQSGLSAKEAAKKILRPAQFKMESAVCSQLSKWKKESLIHALDLIFEAEKQAKTTGFPATLIVQRLVITLTQAGKRA